MSHDSLHLLTTTLWNLFSLYLYRKALSYKWLSQCWIQCIFLVLIVQSSLLFEILWVNFIISLSCLLNVPHYGFCGNIIFFPLLWQSLLCLFWFLLLFFWKMCAFPKAVSAIHFFSASPLIASGPTEQRFYLFPFIVLQNFLQPPSCSTPTPPLSAGDCDPPVRRKQGVKPFGFLSTFCWPPHALPLTSSPLVCEEEKASSCPKPILNHASTHAVLFRNRTYLYWLFPLCLTFSTASSLWFGAHARVHVCVLSHFSHIQLCNPMDYSLPGSSVCRTF